MAFPSPFFAATPNPSSQEAVVQVTGALPCPWKASLSVT